MRVTVETEKFINKALKEYKAGDLIYLKIDGCEDAASPCVVMRKGDSYLSDSIRSRTNSSVVFSFYHGELLEMPDNRTVQAVVTEANFIVDNLTKTKLNPFSC
jgi:hypothetical protein